MWVFSLSSTEGGKPDKSPELKYDRELKSSQNMVKGTQTIWPVDNLHRTFYPLVSLVTRPTDESEARVDLVVIETILFFLSNFQLT